MGGTSADVGILVDGDAAAHDRVRDRVGPAGRGAADRHQVDRRRRRLDRLGRRGRVPPRRAAQRGRAARARSATAAAAREVTVTDANLLLGRLDPDYFLAGRMRLDPDRRCTARWRRSASRSGSRRSSSRRRSSRSRTRTWRARSRWSRSSAATTRGASRCSPSAAPGRSTRRRSRASLGIPKVIVPLYPGVFSALGLLLADIRVDKVWTQAFRSNDVDAALVNRQFGRITERALAELRQEGFAGEPEIRRAINMRYFGQNYEHEVRDRRRRARRGGARARVPPLRRDARRALRLRDRARGDRARQLQGHRDRQARRRSTSRARTARAGATRSERQVYVRGHGLARRAGRPPLRARAGRDDRRARR